MSDRKPLSKRLRFEVFKRDGFRCVYCGVTPATEGALLECDHIKPHSDGGEDDILNLVTACASCNRGKSNIPLSVISEPLNVTAQQIAEREAQLRSYREIVDHARERLDDEVWEVAEIFMDHHCDDSILKTRLASIKMFIQRIGFCEVRDAMEIAASKYHGREKMFRYFCGICWRKIKSEDEGQS